MFSTIFPLQVYRISVTFWINLNFINKSRNLKTILHYFYGELILSFQFNNLFLKYDPFVTMKLPVFLRNCFPKCYSANTSTFWEMRKDR